MNEKLIGSLEDLNRSRRDGLGGLLEFGLPSRAAGPLSYKILVCTRFVGMALFVTAACSSRKFRRGDGADARSSLHRILFHFLYKTLSRSMRLNSRNAAPHPCFSLLLLFPPPHSRKNHSLTAYPHWT